MTIKKVAIVNANSKRKDDGNSGITGVIEAVSKISPCVSIALRFSVPFADTSTTTNGKHSR